MKDLTPRKEELDPIEIASRDEIAALQLKRLKWSLRHAYDNVAHYRERFDTAGVHPDDLKDLADLSKFPFTVKGDLRNNYPFGMFAVPRERVMRILDEIGAVIGPEIRDFASEIVPSGRSERPAADSSVRSAQVDIARLAPVQHDLAVQRHLQPVRPGIDHDMHPVRSGIVQAQIVDADALAERTVALGDMHL